MNEYRVVFDEQYVLAGVSRYRRQRKVYPWFIAVKVLCFLGLAGLLAIVIFAATGPVRGSSAAAVLVALVPGVFLFLLVLGPRIDYFFLKRRLRKSPFYGSETHIVVAHSGLSMKTSKSTSNSLGRHSRRRSVSMVVSWCHRAPNPSSGGRIRH